MSETSIICKAYLIGEARLSPNPVQISEDQVPQFLRLSRDGLNQIYNKHFKEQIEARFDEFLHTVGEGEYAHISSLPRPISSHEGILTSVYLVDGLYVVETSGMPLNTILNFPMDGSKDDEVRAQVESFNDLIARMNGYARDFRDGDLLRYTTSMPYKAGTEENVPVLFADAFAVRLEREAEEVTKENEPIENLERRMFN